MDFYDPAQVYSSIDETGRYAYANQPLMAQWNLARLAEALLPLLAAGEEEAVAEAKDALSLFAPRFNAAYAQGLRAKLGLAEEREGDLALGQDLLALMAQAHADFTGAFRALCDAAEGEDGAFRALFENHPIEAWLARWRARLEHEAGDARRRAERMRAVNPLYIPRNHLVEDALSAAVERDDFEPFETLLDVLSRPFDEQPGRERYAQAPLPEQIVRRTFCGT
jgi:uncharacterized protein YdiU (UPF0061 family)